MEEEIAFSEEEENLLEEIQGDKKRVQLKDLNKKKLSQDELDALFNST